MAPRNRSKQNKDLNKIPNLYRKIDKRTGKANFQYKDPLTKSFRGLGSNEEAAKKTAKQLNAAIYAEILQQQEKTPLTIHHDTKINSIQFPTWINQYLKIQQKRLETGKIKPNTLRTRKSVAKSWIEPFKNHCIKEITVKDISQHLNKIREQGKERMAQSMRSILIDIFSEAIQVGEIDNNPAAITKNESVKVKRARLSVDQWQEIYTAAETLPPWVQNAMLIAIITGQRLEDISLARFKKSADWEPAMQAYKKGIPHPIKPYSYVEDNQFHVVQQKTGTLLKIPLNIKLNKINKTLAEVITQCRKQTLSKHLIHHHNNGYKFKKGDKVHLYSISRSFQRARKRTNLTWEGKTPPTFHEQRSLSERLYAEQGIDTQKLLGHKSEKMTAVYNDVRGSEWLEIKLK